MKIIENAKINKEAEFENRSFDESTYQILRRKLKKELKPLPNKYKLKSYFLTPIQTKISDNQMELSQFELESEKDTIRSAFSRVGGGR